MSAVAAAAVASAVFGVASSVMQYQQARQAATEQRRVLRLKQEQQRHDMSVMDARIKQRRRQNRIALANIRASYGLSGLQLAGSPLLSLAESAQNMEKDVLWMERERDSQTFRDRIALMAQRSRVRQAQSAKTGALFGIGSSAVGFYGAAAAVGSAVASSAPATAGRLPT